MSDPDFPPHPAGATCANCAHFKRCSWLISCAPTATTCDWSPSRFVVAADSNPPQNRRVETHAEPRAHDAENAEAAE